MKKFILLFLCNILFWFPLPAKDIFVSPGGDDGNTGNTPADPLRTIGAALSMSLPGDNIRLLPGIFPGTTPIVNTSGLPENPIKIISHYEIADSFGIIDGGAVQPGLNLNDHAFVINSSSWLVFQNLKFQNCWTDIIPMTNTTYISFIGCDFVGGRRVIKPQGHGCHHFLIENCSWEQHEGVWTTFDWEEMHHGSLAYYNGALFHPIETAGGFVFRNNDIVNVFNAFRTRPYDIREDCNGEVYNNSILNVADNDFEPEGWAWNLHYYHNTLKNIHKLYSIDDVQGGWIYIYGNVINQTTDANALQKVSGVYKFKNGPLTNPCYVFNNSYYTKAEVFRAGEATNQQMKHFNNAYYFFQGSNRFILSDWHDTFEFNYDCSNQNWPVNIINHQQELNGIVGDILFVDGLNGDFRLQSSSPGIDGGVVMSFPELGWIQQYDGSAPDIGAFEGPKRIDGPPFRFREPPGGGHYQEKPAIVRHHLNGNELTLFFSFPINPSSIPNAGFHIFQDSLEISITNISHSNNNYSIILTTGQSLEEERLSLYMKPRPLGTNGEFATHWASTVPVADLSLITLIDGKQTSESQAVAEVQPQMDIFPNPFNDRTTVIIRLTKPISYLQIGNQLLRLYDINGKVVLEQLPEIRLHSIQYQIESSQLSSGVYFAAVNCPLYSVTGKILVVK